MEAWALAGVGKNSKKNKNRSYSSLNHPAHQGGMSDLVTVLLKQKKKLSARVIRRKN
jgi:hypothetical protein